MDRDCGLRMLARKARSGDMQAFESLVRETHHPLFTLLHMLRIPDRNAEEVAQDVVVRVYQALRRYDARRPFLPWLCGIARHAAADFWQASERREAAWMNVEWIALAEEAAAQDSEKEMCVDRLRECIARLLPKYRELVSLRYFQGMDSHDIGRLLRSNPAAVRQSLSRIREALRKCVRSGADIRETEWKTANLRS